MDRFEAMAILVAAVEGGSLTAASRRLNIPLPTLSRRLGELEAHLGTRLLARSTRRLSLTEAGEAYFRSSKRILDDVDEAERAAVGQQTAPRGELVVTAPLVFGRLHVLPVVNAFLGLYPDIDVRMHLSDRNAHLIEDHIDIAIRIGVLADSSMTGTRLGQVRRVVCGSPSFFERHGVPASPKDLESLPCVTFDLPGSATGWTFAIGAKRREQTVRVHARLQVNTAEAALDAAIAGIGVTRVLSYQAESAIRQGLLRVALGTIEAAPLPVYLLSQGQNPLPIKTRSFLDFAAGRLRERLEKVTRLLADRPSMAQAQSVSDTT